MSEEEKQMNRISYIDEIDFTKKLKGLKRINMRAYKELIFNKLKAGSLSNTPGKHIEELPSYTIFEKVYGKIQLIYTTLENGYLIEDLTPQQMLLEHYAHDVSTYEGIPYIASKDIFKIQLTRMMNNV